MDQPTYGFQRPSGDIVTLLELTPRDFQDNHYFPLSSEKTWWLPNSTTKIHPFTMSLQQTPFRGPTAFGQRFTFDVKSNGLGDILCNTFIQIQLGHWLDDTSIMRLQTKQYEYSPSNIPPWSYSKELGSVIIERAELEVNEQTLEVIDGDFIHVHTCLFQNINSQYGVLSDGLGAFTSDESTCPYPTQNGTLCIPLPFFFHRMKLQETLPLLAIKDGAVRIHVTLRPFEECIRRIGTMSPDIDVCGKTPLGSTFQMTSTTPNGTGLVNIETKKTPPPFKNIQLLTYAAHTDGSMRDSILHTPFEQMIRTVQTFSFKEPLKYTVNTTSSDTIQIQLPLEVNHPMEEIIWFIRRKACTNKNEYTNYSSVTEFEEDATFNPRQPLLVNASIYLNSTELISADEKWYRRHISLLHEGGVSAYKQFIYGYSFSKNPGHHQPSGTANASRISSIRLLLSVRPPGGDDIQDWEVKVYVTRLEWLRFQNGIANRIYMD